MLDQSEVRLTVVQAQGLRLIVPDKSWRPIVTMEVDRQHTHEVVLGVDGQNVDLSKYGLQCHDIRPTSVIELKVWNATQSKKKGKKRQLVASASHTLSDLLQRTKVYKTTRSKAHRHAEVRLTCHPCTKRNISASKGRPQNGATLTVRVESPNLKDITVVSPSDDSQQVSIASSSSGPASIVDSEDDYSSTLAAPPDKTPDNASPYKGLRRRRKRTKHRLSGFRVYSDGGTDLDICYASSAESTSSLASQYTGTNDHSQVHYKPSVVFEEPTHDSPLANCFESDTEHEGGLPVIHDGVVTIASNPVSRWIAASLLPQHIYEFPKPDLPPYSEPIPIQDPRQQWWEMFISAFTVYVELRNATMDSDFEAIFHRIRMEWTFVGTLLAGLAAVNTAVLSISPDSSIQLSALALRAIACSSIFTGLGIAAAAYFILRYSFSPPQVFRTRALDVYSSYVFFSISARVPTLCMVASAISLMAFLGLVAFDLWPTGVIVVSFLFGVVMSLQFLIFGCHQLGKGVLGGGRRVARAGRGLARRVTGSDDAPSLRPIPVVKADRKAVGGRI